MLVLLRLVLIEVPPVIVLQEGGLRVLREKELRHVDVLLLLHLGMHLWERSLNGRILDLKTRI